MLHETKLQKFLDHLADQPCEICRRENDAETCGDVKGSETEWCTSCQAQSLIDDWES